jgi:hypothetical protein
MMDETDTGISKEDSHPDMGLPERFHRISTIPNGMMSKQDAIEMRFGLLLAERDELVEYVKALKVLAVYLAGSTSIRPENISARYFTKAEQNFPEYMRREMDVGINE